MKRKRLNEDEGRGSHRPLRNKAICCLISVAFLWVAGCEGRSPTSSVPKAKGSLAEKNNPPPAQLAGKTEAEKKPEVAVEYSYNAEGKPDPFKPFIQLVPVKGGSKNLPLTPLQRYEVSQLKLVAVMSTPTGNVALVEDSTGKGFFLKRGTLVGKNDGRVSKILKDKVIVEETYRDVLGQAKQSEVSLNLYQTEEGGEP